MSTTLSDLKSEQSRLTKELREIKTKIIISKSQPDRGILLAQYSAASSLWFDIEIALNMAELSAATSQIDQAKVDLAIEKLGSVEQELGRISASIDNTVQTVEIIQNLVGSLQDLLTIAAGLASP